MTTSMARLLIRKINDGKADAEVYYCLAMFLDGGQSATTDGGDVLTQKKCLLKAITCDGKHYASFYTLGLLVDANESVTLEDGKIMTKADLFKKTIEIDRDNSRAYYELAGTMSSVEEKIKCYLDVIAHSHKQSSEHSKAYNNIGELMESPDETVTTVDGETLTRRQCFMRAVEYDPTTNRFLDNLLSTMLIGEKIVLSSGRTIFRKEDRT